LAKDFEESWEKLAEHGSNLILGKIVLHKLRKDLKGAVDRIGRDRKCGDEVIEEVRVLIWPV